MNKKYWIYGFGLGSLVILISVLLAWLVTDIKLNRVEIVLAKHDLSGRVQLTQNDLVIKAVPKEVISPEMITDKQELIGKYVKIDSRIPKDSFIYRSQVESLDESIDAPALLLKENQAVFSLDVSLVQTAGNSFQKGQKLDIYGTVKQNRDVFVDLLISNARIVGIKDKNGNEISAKTNQLPKVILLAIMREDIPLLTKLNAMGNVTLSPGAYFSVEEASLNTESLLLEVLHAR